MCYGALSLPWLHLKGVDDTLRYCTLYRGLPACGNGFSCFLCFTAPCSPPSLWEGNGTRDFTCVPVFEPMSIPGHLMLHKRFSLVHQ